MSLERNETARRFMEALLHAGEPQEIAKTVEIAVGCTDALLAALVPVAPASGAPATEPRRTVGAVVKTPGFETEWVVLSAFAVRRLDSEKGGESQIACKSDEFVRWATREECERHGIPYVARPLPGAPLAAPSPAATPAAWVPSVGDVVKHVNESDATALKGKIRVVVSTSPLRWVYVEDGKACGSNEPRGWVDDVRFVRPATSSERAAAGLPVDESATKPVDREGLLAAMRAAFHEWRRTSEDTRYTEVVATDAAIAFMAKGGAS